MGLSDLSKHGVPMRWLYRALPVASFEVNNFSGGLDLSAPFPEGRLPGFLQFRNVDPKYGGAVGRTGLGSALTGGPAGVDYAIYSTIYDAVILAQKTANHVYKATNFSTTAVTQTQIDTGLPVTSTGSDLVEFNGKLLQINRSGLYSYDGTSWSLVTSGVTGTMIVSWQNKLWVSDTNTNRIVFSKAGDFTSWDALDYVDIRDGRDSEAPVSTLFVSEDMDIQGRPSFLVGKVRSLHRINDATTGSYSTLSGSIGVLGKRAIASNSGLAVFLSTDGIFATNGVSVPEDVSAKVAPLFSDDGATDITADSRVVWYDDQFWIAMPGWDPLSGVFTTANVVNLAWSPKTGMWSNHTHSQPNAHGVEGFVKIPAGALAGSTKSALERLIVWDNASGFFLRYAGSGSTNGTMIVQTPFLPLAGGSRFRVQRVRARFYNTTNGAGITLRVRRDGSATDSIVRTATGFSSDTYNNVVFNRLGDCRTLSLVVESSSLANASASAFQADSRTPRNMELISLLIEYTPTGQM